ncbi:MAG TPA: hypothetical protein PKD72_09830, partial [Gemmatales bacterium]|nr:hypothetical protein [Gemmatales bacterium]
VIYRAAMRYRGMATVCTTNMDLYVAATVVRRGAARGVGRGYCQYVLYNLIPLYVVQVPIMQIVDMAIMLDGSVTTVAPMDVGMIFMGMCHHATPVWVTLSCHLVSVYSTLLQAVFNLPEQICLRMRKTGDKFKFLLFHKHSTLLQLGTRATVHQATIRATCTQG